MEAAVSPRQYKAKERQAQLQSTEALYDAGLYKSALLVTGIQLSTVKKDEGWFHSRALLRYAQSLSRLQEHHRSTIFYEKASYYGTSPVPSDLLVTETAFNAGEPSTKSQGSEVTAEPKATVSRPVSVTEQMLIDARLDRATVTKDRQARENIKDQLIGLASGIAAMKKKAAILSAAKATQAANPISAGLTKAAPATIPDVKLRSTAMKHHVGNVKSRAQHLKRLSANKEFRSPSISSSPLTSPASPGTVTAEQSVEQYAIDTKILHARACFEAKDYGRAGELVKYLWIKLIFRGHEGHLPTTNVISDREKISQIPESKWTVEVLLLMTQLYRQRVILKMEEKACWESIAEKQPLAVEAYEQLLRLQVPLAIVLNMIPSDSPEKPWLKTYLQGMDSIYRMKYQAALSDFSALDGKYPGNTAIKLRMAICLKWMGKYVRAGFLYAQVRHLDSRVCDDMFHYGVCLKQLSKMKYLNRLASELLGFNDKHPDAWCVLAMYWDMKGNKNKAFQMVSKALQLRPDHCGALQLRGQLYLELPVPEPAVAVQSFRKAYSIEKDIATYEGLVNAYILTERKQEAVAMAREAKRLMPDSAHALAIYGTAIYHMTGESNAKEARDILQEALRMDPGCVQAAATLVMLHGHQGHYDAAVQILEEQIDHQPPDTVHVKIAEIYTATERWEEAYMSYGKALSSNPDNERAREGMMHVEKILNGGDEEEDEDSYEGGDDHDDLNSDPGDQQHNWTQGHVDEDDILTGDEDHREDYDESYPPQQNQQSTQHTRGFGYQHSQQQAPVRNPQRMLDQYAQPPVHQTPNLRNANTPAPGFSVGHPQTPSRSRFPTTFQGHREREYDEAGDSEGE
ncbi:Anaphase-promoting complex subunit 7 [Mortierella alpina]|nr:Anaphase-promoting complex subunit 7 [Mortierella alpina]